jgi:hypothetical protein
LRQAIPSLKSINITFSIGIAARPDERIADWDDMLEKVKRPLIGGKKQAGMLLF